MVLTYISCSVVQHAAALCFSIAASATFSLFNLPLSDVIDVDQDKYKRKYDATGLCVDIHIVFDYILGSFLLCIVMHSFKQNVPVHDCTYEQHNYFTTRYHKPFLVNFCELVCCIFLKI